MNQSSTTDAQQHNELYQPYLSLNMTYAPGANSNITGKRRRQLTMMIVARFNIISPTLIMWLYGVSKHQALEHLNKLVKEQLLEMMTTFRSPDGRVYVLSYNGARYAEELMCMSVYFRSTANPALQFNANSVHHDLIAIYCCLRGVKNQLGLSMWNGIITEPEFKRLFKSNAVRNVDGLVMEADGCIAAIEIEHSFKNKQAREKILLKWLYALKEGYYSKVFLFSQSQHIFEDIKRFHRQLFDELPSRYDKASKKPLLSEADVLLLQSAIIYRTKFCDEITALFYR
ncbi:hypothetical protein [Psychrobium sp. 1_MG-2023]|uniref:hypothetical protein n=1 Tax=Psychrobium sp. 1_MG-2023 TaxID=3062624 RepID=UPI000C31C96D|nr:hypothetical protein [Psychrobium sp. 1_MG-2023]MDP2561185.1 hypothetical protein [Psychrobium sp. 1_MG-2023]PKF55309.1 hypothetical protein CW748_13925 [Alteromonadales bacterium alter-6D02]